MSRGGLENFNSERLQTLRKRAGWTRAAIAVQCGVTVTSVRGWETGRIAPSESNVLALAAALDVHPAALTDTPRNRPTLLQLRQWQGLRAVDAAELAGIGVDGVYNAESYVSPITPRVRKALADAYDMNERQIAAAWQRGRKRKWGHLAP